MESSKKSGNNASGCASRERRDTDSADVAASKQDRALERKRAADRNARRLERSRTKSHIAQLEAQIKLQSDAGSSALVEKLLKDNAALTERNYEYQKQINSARLVLEWNASTESSRDQQTAAQVDLQPHQPPALTNIATSTNHHQQALVSSAQSYDVSASPHLLNDSTMSVTSSIVGPNLLGRLFNSTYLPGGRSIYMLHHPSPLATTCIYRTAAGVPGYHEHRTRSDLDVSAGYTLADVMGDEKLDTFLGSLLPIFSPSLIGLYQGVSDNLSGLDPFDILHELLPGKSPRITRTHPIANPNTIQLLRASLAKYTACTIREAQDALTPEKRRSETEIVAVFWIMSRLLIWMAFPTAKNYTDIPPWYRPTQAQLSVPHPSFIDLLVFPLLREKLVHTYANYKDTTLLEHLNSSFTITWEPKVWLLCQQTPLIFPSPDDPWEFRLEPNFESAISDLRSWRMKPELRAMFPELASCVHF